MSDTLGSLRAEILLELRGDLAADSDIPLINSKINNALEAVWMAMMKAALERFFGSDGPVNFTIAQGAQRVQLVSIPDPTVAPTVNQVAGGAFGGRTIFVAYTFVTESGSETNLSPVTTVNVNANNLCQVVAPMPISGESIYGWNVYAVNEQLTAGMVLQNPQPLPMGNTSASFVLNIPFNEPVTGFVTYGDSTGANQLAPTSNQTADNIAYINHLEIVQSDTTIRAIDQESINSLAMRGLARTLASASEYQNYAWDLINGRVIELRPPAGTTFSANSIPTPRYFFVAKPRRLRYDQAEIPYQSIAGVHEYLTNKTIGDLKLTLDEYISAQAYVGAAGLIRQEIVTSLAQESWGKNRSITPYLY